MNSCSELHEGALLHNIKMRFLKNLIYVSSWVEVVSGGVCMKDDMFYGVLRRILAVFWSLSTHMKYLTFIVWRM